MKVITRSRRPRWIRATLFFAGGTLALLVAYESTVYAASGRNTGTEGRSCALVAAAGSNDTSDGTNAPSRNRPRPRPPEREVTTASSGAWWDLTVTTGPYDVSDVPYSSSPGKVGYSSFPPTSTAR
jgi:hypothetical protein